MTTAAALYSKTLQEFHSLPAEEKVSLFRYCKEHGVNYHGLYAWKRQKSINSSDSGQDKLVSAASFVPVSIIAPPSPVQHTSSSSPSGLLKGVSIALKDGVKVSIEEIIVSDIIEILHSFAHRPNLCLR